MATQYFGVDEDGSTFDPQPMSSVAIRSDSRVDAIIINGQRYGGGGGLSPTLTLREGEYINCIVVHAGGDGGGLAETLTLHAGELINRVVVRHDRDSTVPAAARPTDPPPG